MTVNRQRLAAVLFWIAILAIAWFAYAPALGGVFVLDDISNLQGLKLIEDKVSALDFVFSGAAGPLGRPLALSTFVPQATEWGASARPFLIVNILIHLVNGCILAWLLYRLANASRIREGDALVVAIAGSGIWLLMPLLASASFMIIQRMTTLSAFFVLLGLAGYLEARLQIERRANRALIGMSLSLIIGTILAVLCKENGILLPLFVLVMEGTLLGRPDSIKPSLWRAWKAAFLGVPTLVILAYLMWQVPYSHEIVLGRGFTAWERLMTESRILWKYLFDAFIPQPGQFGPFHDGYPVARTIMNPLTLLAFLGWVVVSTMALLWRHRYPVFAFAVLWFLVGHILESTLIPLELYFEHRNYLPIIGPAFALCAVIVRVRPARKRLAWLGMVLYLLVNALVLFSLASLWGKPPEAARYWQAHFPESVRAATTAAGYQLVAEGLQSTVQTLREVVERKPEAGYLKIQELNLSCMIDPSEDQSSRVSALEHSLDTVDFTYSALSMLSQLLTTVSKLQCNGADVHAVRKLARTLLSNPAYAINSGYNQIHQELMALIAQHEGKLDLAIQHLEKAIQYARSPKLNTMMVLTYVAQWDFEAAREYIKEARVDAPRHPIKRYVWMRKLDELSLYIDEVEQNVTSDSK